MPDAPAERAISFVGGNCAGEYMFARGSAAGKSEQANRGAKNHAVLLPDAERARAQLAGRRRFRRYLLLYRDRSPAQLLAPTKLIAWLRFVPATVTS